MVGSEDCDWKKGWRMTGGWKKGCPWVCSDQILLKQGQMVEPLSEPPYLHWGNQNVCMTRSAEVLALLWCSGTEPQ